jgi:hypothetical protein
VVHAAGDRRAAPKGGGVRTGRARGAIEQQANPSDFKPQRGAEVLGRAAHACPHAPCTHKPDDASRASPAVCDDRQLRCRVLSLAGCTVASHSQNGRVEANQEETHESDRI